MKPSEIKKQFSDKVRAKTVISCRYGDIEWLINQVFKNEKHKERYELPGTEERGSGDGEDWEVSIKKEVFGEYEKEDLSEVEQGEWPMYCTRILLTECCNRGIIPEGDYLIDISW